MDSLAPILYIDDDTDDLVLFRLLLTKTGVRNPLVTFRDGVAAIGYYTSSGPEHGVQPFIVFTDLKMPHVGGYEFCRWVRRSSIFRAVTMFVLSGSDAEKDIRGSHDAGADGHLAKFPTPSELSVLLRAAGGTFTDAEVVSNSLSV